MGTGAMTGLVGRGEAGLPAAFSCHPHPREPRCGTGSCQALPL